MADYVLNLREIDRARATLAGGKGANLGELARIDGVRVPSGFCVTTAAFEQITVGIGDLLERLSGLGPDDRAAIGALSAEIRAAIEAASVPAEIAGHVRDGVAYAVRSSATAEDTPTASFAGQHDTYLDVVGPAAVLEHVRRCWASLFTERAVTYRLSHGADHRTVRMAVVVQEMVVPRASGILFTADPVTSNRRVSSIDAVAGLGEALVSGLVNADVYQVRDGVVTIERVAGEQVLTAPEILGLERLGRRIEAHFGRPQDIEWCLDGDGVAIVQSRPITTLFPIPVAGDEERHVYLSVGHQQMMTEAMKPLGLAVWKLTSPGQMCDAGGRLFVDVAPRMASPETGAALLDMVGRGDPLTGDALRTLFPDLREQKPAAPPEPNAPDPAVVAELIEQNETALAALKRDITSKSGAELLDFIQADIEDLQRTLFTPISLQAIMAGMDATRWLNEHLEQWLGERNVADTLSQSVAGNVTSEMGLALLDVADVIRPHPEVVAFLQNAGEGFLDGLTGPVADALRAFLDRYGMRCVGEIDITRPRWSERPETILPMILANVRNFADGERARHFERGRLAAEEKEREVLARLRRSPGGERRATATKQKIDVVRAFSGYREYPKYHMVSRYLVYKQALLAEAGRFLADPEDIFHLTYHELYDAVRTRRVDAELVRARAEEFAWFRTLRPPRVLTSEGEVVTGTYRREDVPAGALIGLPVSAGTIEGRARVVPDVAGADLETGDILVTAYTDPSWTPVFVTVAGLVTEVGGLMTHGAVIAREYGLPAVVGVENATTLIRDGQRIRVHGTDGYVEVLPA